LVKYIGRIAKDTPLKQGAQEDEDGQSAVTEIGPKIDIQDPMDVKERTIFFSGEQTPMTKQEIVQEKSEQLKDQLNTTNQYQKFVNVVLQERMGDLKKLLEKEKKFSEELSYFQDTAKSRYELEKVNAKYITEADTKTLISNLESEYVKMKEKLDFELSKIEKTKNELETKRQQIDQLKEEMKFIVKKEQKVEKIDDPILTIKHELKKLGISDDTGKITEALRLLSKKMNHSS
jgi:DNA repair exonuclease SbcCD ATPase subunit